MTALLTEDGCRQRRQRLWDALPDDVLWVLVADPRHVAYLSGFWVNPLSFSQGERGLLVLHRDGESVLYADNFVRRSAVADPYVDREVIGKWYDHRGSMENRDAFLQELLFSHWDPQRYAASQGAMEGEALPLAYAQRGELAKRSSLGDCLRGLRRCKQHDEIALLARCMRAGEAGHARALEVIRPGMTDFELYRHVQEAAVDSAGVPALVYGDFRGNQPQQPKAGGPPIGSALNEGDLFILDYSVVIQGYRCDFTNTLAVGQPSAEQQRLFDACHEALRQAEAVLAPGVSARAVYDAASGVLDKAGYGPLAHHAGHGLGLGHPEPPTFVPESDDHLVDGDVVTLEPGAYVAGVGGVRLEHNYHVDSHGTHRLSNHALRLRD